MSQSRYPNWEALRDSDPSFIDEYTLEARLGSGGFGVVYAATAADGSPVALKVLRPELSDDPALRRRLAREAEALRRVEGNRTVQVLDVVIDDDQTYLVMERLEGVTLDDLVKDEGPLQAASLWSVAEGLIDALGDIHAAGVVHRDLKPSNVIVGPDGVKVLDFGISVIAEQTSLTQTGAFVGTAAWISPEQIRDEDVTEATDIFNFGLVMAFAATGRHPFGTGRNDALMYRISSEEPDFDDLASPLKEALSLCLQQEPRNRPSVSDLAKFIASKGTTELTTTSKLVGRKLVAVWAAMIAVAAIAGIVVSQTSDTDDVSANPPTPAVTIIASEEEAGDATATSAESQIQPAAVQQQCQAISAQNEVEIETADSRYRNVIPRADHTSDFLFDNLRYEGNNPEMRTATETAEPQLPTAEEVAGRWRTLIQITNGMFVLRDSLFSQQDHPFKHGSPCALMMPPNWITSAVLVPNPAPMEPPPVDDEKAWQETRDDPSTVFGSFPPSEDLLNYASQLSTDQDPTLRNQIIAARSTIRLLGSFADELLRARDESGADAVIDRGAELIAAGDNTYFGDVRGKAIPLMGVRPSEEDTNENKGFCIQGLQALEDACDKIIETVMRRRLIDGDLALQYRYRYPFDLSSPTERLQAVTTLSRVIPPDAPPGGDVWLWIWGGHDTDIYSIDVFEEELQSEEIDLNRLKFYAKPASEIRGNSAAEQFESLIDSYDGYGVALSVNTDALGVSKWMQ